MDRPAQENTSGSDEVKSVTVPRGDPLVGLDHEGSQAAVVLEFVGAAHGDTGSPADEFIVCAGQRMNQEG